MIHTVALFLEEYAEPSTDHAGLGSMPIVVLVFVTSIATMTLLDLL